MEPDKDNIYTFDSVYQRTKRRTVGAPKTVWS